MDVKYQVLLFILFFCLFSLFLFVLLLLSYSFKKCKSYCFLSLVLRVEELTKLFLFQLILRLIFKSLGNIFSSQTSQPKNINKQSTGPKQGKRPKARTTDIATRENPMPEV